MFKLYTDGGVINRNPSPIGGTWAWVLCDDDTMVRHEAGIILPGDIGLPVITNNVAELLAVIHALEAMPPGWEGRLLTDSACTMSRICARQEKDGKRRTRLGKLIPAWHLERLDAALLRVGVFDMRLLGGHPTRSELDAGFRRDGVPCSIHNVRCDKLCTEQARKHLAQLGEKPWTSTTPSTTPSPPA